MSKPDLLALGIDTSTRHGSVGLSGPSGPIAQIELHSASNHVERLLPAIDTLLADAGLAADQLDLIAVATGPGSFTGVRIAMATGKGLALATHRPLAGYSTLETMAVAAAVSSQAIAAHPVCVVLRAGRGELYRGLYLVKGGQVTSIVPEAAVSPARAIEGLPEYCALVGDGAEDCLSYRGSAAPAGWILHPSAPPIGVTLAGRAIDGATRAGFEGFPALMPNYLRLSDAEVNVKSS